VPQDLISNALGLELADGSVVGDRVGETDCDFPCQPLSCRTGHRRAAVKACCGQTSLAYADKAVPWIEQRVGLTLAESQKVAVRLALASKVLVITGGPGMGKPTIVNSILRILAAKGVRLQLCASTGRPAKRMSEATGLEAKTIRRLLEVDPRAAVSGAMQRFH
jgi:exodeoxyribonuclease V alpha subunit